MEEIFVEQTHSLEIQRISDKLRGCASGAAIDRELIENLNECSIALLSIARLYDITLNECGVEE